MRTLINHLTVMLAMGAFFTGILAFTVSGDWDIPAEYAEMENPFDADDESLDIGKDIYIMHCKSCHGKYGEGDGPKADNLDSDCGDFTLEEFQEQSDGVLFYKTKFGKDDMPTFEKKIPDDDEIWHVINYIRDMGE